MSVAQRRVVCAAIQNNLGHIICSARHFDRLMHRQIDMNHCANELWKVADQGFIDQFGVFMTREDALVVALAANQRIRRCGGDEKRLYSENLY